MKIYWKKLLFCIAVPLAVGGLSAFLTRDSMETFKELNQPSLSPPPWLFPVVWTILYILMGVASYIILVSKKENRSALTVYAIQLAFNFIWPLIFFNMRNYLFAFIWLVALWALIAATIYFFRKISKPAAYLLLPYIIWVTFAGYLNYSIYILN